MFTWLKQYLTGPDLLRLMLMENAVYLEISGL